MWCGGCLLSVMTVVVHDWRILVVLAGVLTCAPVVLTEVMKELSGSSVINVGVDQEEQRNHKEKESNVTSPSHFTCPKSKQITILLMICWYVCTWHIAVELGAVLWCDCYQMVLLCFSIWLRFSCSSIYYGITIALQHSSIRHYGNLECVLSSIVKPVSYTHLTLPTIYSV